MLKLTRYKGQQIVIKRGQINIKVLSIQNEVVALAIKAPRGVDLDNKRIFTKFRTLVLIKREGEQLLFNNGQIEVKILSINLRKNLVTLGIQAPSEIDIDRLEIFIKKQANVAMNDPSFAPLTKFA